MDTSSMLLALVACPLALSVIMAIIPKTTSRVVFELCHLVSAVVVLAGSVLVALPVFTAGGEIWALDPWFHVDALGALFVLIIGLIGFCIAVYSVGLVRQLTDDGKYGPSQVKQYYAFYSLFLFTMLLAATTNNIIIMWAAIEATTLASALLVALKNTHHALEATWKYIMVCTAGVAFGLFGTLLIYANAADVITDPHMAAFISGIMPEADKLDPAIVRLAFAFIVIGFGTKAEVFPMHTWMPDTLSQAPGSISALLSGVVLKCSMLIIIRFDMLASRAIGGDFPHLLLLIVGVCSIVFSSFALFAQKDIKRKLAYSSCENAGVIMLCLGIGGPLGIAAALLHSMFHGLAKSLCFCLTENVEHAFGTRDLTQIKGIVERAPITAALMVVGFLALAGFPPFAMFISEFMTFVAAFAAGSPWWLVVIVALALTVAISGLTRVVITSVFGKTLHEPVDTEHRESSAWMLVPEIVLAVCIAWFGIATPAPIVRGVENAVSIVLDQSNEELHTAPMFREFFGSETAQSEVE